MKTTKRLITVSLAGLAVALAGCIAVSVYPFYAEKDVVFEPGLLGGWTNPDNPQEHWKLEKQGERAYRVTQTDGAKTNVMTGHSFRLNGELFLDLFTAAEASEIVPPPIPSHMVIRVFQQKPTLRMATLNYEWLVTLLEANPKSLRHHVLVDEKDPNNRQVVLTADTAELQAFLIKHLKTEEAWKNVIEMKRE